MENIFCHQEKGFNKADNICTPRLQYVVIYAHCIDTTMVYMYAGLKIIPYKCKEN